MMEAADDDDERESRSDYEGSRGGRKQVKMGTTRRNARERNRVRHINACFEVLRQHVPQDKHQKKLSKVDTLKSAMNYIENLRQLLDFSTHRISSSSSTHINRPYSMVMDIKAENAPLYHYVVQHHHDHQLGNDDEDDDDDDTDESE